MSALGRARRLPVKYLDAFRAAGRLRSRPPLEPGEALAWAASLPLREDHVRATQAEDEIVWLLERLRAEAPSTIVEIGTDQGGTLFLWPYVASHDALIVAIDSRPLGRLGRYSPYAIVRRAFGQAEQRIELLMPADSHEPQTVARLRRLLAGRPVDFLFIDGDHSYEGVKRDFELFSPLVRPGGTVAFHDVAGDAWPGVVRFFGELGERYESESVVGRGERRHGIGVVRIPGKEGLARR